MNNPLRRLANRARGTIELARCGATAGTIVSMPLRRRLGARELRIRLRSGISLSAPTDGNLRGIFREIWLERCYRPAGWSARPRDTIVDIGGNVGVFALWAASEYPGARIISVEPSPLMCEYLRRNVRDSRRENVVVMQAACGGSRREAMLYRRGGEQGNSLYCRDNYGSRFEPLARVPVVTLADVFECSAVSECGLLKLDCEGAEYEILLGAGDDLLDRIGAIALEYHAGLNDYQPDDLVRHLSARHFAVSRTPFMDEEGGYLYAVRTPATPDGGTQPKA